jgi:hypothetical protein
MFTKKEKLVIVVWSLCLFMAQNSLLPMAPAGGSTFRWALWWLLFGWI